MLEIEGDYPVRDNRNVTTLEFELAAQQLADLTAATAVNGGGGYLSNEISYRVIQRLSKFGGRVRSGHIHVPRINYDPSGSGPSRARQVR